MIRIICNTAYNAEKEGFTYELKWMMIDPCGGAPLCSRIEQPLRSSTNTGTGGGWAGIYRVGNTVTFHWEEKHTRVNTALLLSQDTLSRATYVGKGVLGPKVPMTVCREREVTEAGAQGHGHLASVGKSRGGYTHASTQPLSPFHTVPGPLTREQPHPQEKNSVSTSIH